MSWFRRRSRRDVPAGVLAAWIAAQPGGPESVEAIARAGITAEELADRLRLLGRGGISMNDVGPLPAPAGDTPSEL